MKIPIRDLQPGDTEETIEQIKYLSSLSYEDLMIQTPIPQVWKLNDMNLLSDGNKRVRELARRGYLDVEVEFYNHDHAFSFMALLSPEYAKAQELREQGIFNAYDLIRKSA